MTSSSRTSSTLTSALITILISTSLCVVLVVVAAIWTGEWLYLVAALLFAISGGAGIWVVRRLRAAIEKK
jgi:ABC-type bacteriocin/lantibiotic exporter with double-glycine peptidase domain